MNVLECTNKPIRSVVRMLLMMIFISTVFLSCSSDDESSFSNDTFELSINGHKIDQNIALHNPDIKKIENIFYFNFSFLGESSNFHNNLRFRMNEEGKVLDCKLDLSLINNSIVEYYNFIHYPSYFFESSILEHNPARKKIKVKLKGYVYRNRLDINSEKILVEVMFNYFYESIENVNYDLVFNPYNFPHYPLFYELQYFRVNFNDKPWQVTHSHFSGAFYSVDPYHVVIKLNNQTTLGNYSFDQTLNTNTIKFYKFNVNTLEYDEFNVSGSLNLSYIEAHGADVFSYFGTFNLIATNPMDSSESFHLNNGEFRVLNPYSN
jgi:hypothetical protein